MQSQLVRAVQVGVWWVPERPLTRVQMTRSPAPTTSGTRDHPFRASSDRIQRSHPAVAPGAAGCAQRVVVGGIAVDCPLDDRIPAAALRWRGRIASGTTHRRACPASFAAADGRQFLPHAAGGRS